jgi:trans-aconitate methyltransferase
MITPQIVCESIAMHYDAGMLKYNNFMMPTGMEPELDKRESVMLAKYVVERFRPRIMLDLGCRRAELLKTIYKTGIDIYGLKEETEIILTEEEFPAARISSFDLAHSYWKSPVKFDLIWTGSALEYSGKTAENVADTIISNLKKGGLLVVTPPPQAHEAGVNWVDEWITRLSKVGLTMLEDETDRIRRVTHRVGSKGTELVFMRV